MTELVPPFTIPEPPGARDLGSFAALAALPGVAHGVTTRNGFPFGPHADAPATAAAARALAGRLGLADVAWCRQVHGPRVLRVTAGGLAGEADALVTATPGLAVLGRSADCPLVLAAALARGRAVAVGMAHASWRATVAGVTARMLEALRETAGGAVDRFVAAIAPSAGPCCYEVGEEVRAAALAELGPRAAAFFARRDGRLVFDLWGANADQLAQGGVRAADTHVAGLCTICRPDLFPSWRVEREAAGRFGAAVGLL